jgi:hypothetical protein
MFIQIKGSKKKEVWDNNYNDKIVKDLTKRGLASPPITITTNNCY